MSTKDAKQTPPPEKQPYATPIVVGYGNVHELTRTNVTNNMNDPGNGSATMT
jgi:hypothetical protein